MTLERLPGLYAVCRFAPGAPIPGWTVRSRILSIARSEHELSIVCEESCVPGAGDAAAPHESDRGWVGVRIAGKLPFDLVGVLARLTGGLAGAGIPCFAFSTFDTDYVLFKAQHEDRALAALRTVADITG